VCTLPRQLAPLALQNKRLICNLLFHASAETLLEVARDPRHLGAEIGFFSVLQGWNQCLQFHPHVHCVLAACGLAPDQSRWISARHSFSLPIGVLSRVFRRKFVAGLRNAFQRGELQFRGDLLPLAQSCAFAAWLRVLFWHDWVAYSQRPFILCSWKKTGHKKGLFRNTGRCSDPSHGIWKERETEKSQTSTRFGDHGT
jgi:hypothetical protein